MILKKIGLKLPFPKSLLKKSFIVISATALTALLALLIYNTLFFKKIFPGIYIANLSVSGMDRQEAENFLAENVSIPEKVYLTNNSKNLEADLQSFDFHYDFKESSALAYKLGRSGNIIKDLLARSLFPVNKAYLNLTPKLNEDKLDEYISIISDELSENPVYPKVEVVNGEINIEKGLRGHRVDNNELKNRFYNAVSQNPVPQVIIPTYVIDPTLTDEETQNLKIQAEKLVGKNLKLTLNNEEFTLNEDKLFNFLLRNDNNLAGQNVIEEIEENFDRDAENPIFIYRNGRVDEFSPAKEGIKVDSKKLNGLIALKVMELENSDEKTLQIEIPAEVTPPEISTGEVNNLGIKELIGKGTSRFSGSISSRIHNIGLASSHFNGVLVAPGGIFSFNNTLGDVSSYTGYQQAYIIRDGRTVLGDGGGVCQVSTTLFRAILDAGLPVVERRAHSYRVSYYEQGSSPGLDATVYSPTTDLKFKNDTPAYLLIQTVFDPTNYSLAFEIYGTDDARVSSITKPVVSGVTPPPPELYQDDPLLPTGTVKQIDYAAWGTKVSFSYKVTKGGETLFQKEFYSNYQPWQAVYLRGTGPVN